MDFRPYWYEAAHAASEIVDDDAKDGTEEMLAYALVALLAVAAIALVVIAFRWSA